MAHRRAPGKPAGPDRERTTLKTNSHKISYAVFFFNNTATTEIYTLSLHDALPILQLAAAALDELGDGPGQLEGETHRQVHEQVEGLIQWGPLGVVRRHAPDHGPPAGPRETGGPRSGEDNSENQFTQNLVCRFFF